MHLAPSTVKTTSEVIDTMIVRRIGRAQVGRLTTHEVDAWLSEMASDGLSKDRQRRALRALRMLLSAAMDWDYASRNVAAQVKMPKAPMREPVRPVGPETIEAMRADLLSAGRWQDSILISAMAYAGLRPGEATSTGWQDVGERALLVKAAKTSKVRSVVLLESLRSDLTSWHLSCGRPSAGPVYPRPRTETWTDSTFRNWRRRIFDPAAEAAGAPDLTPKALRHCFASLMHAAHKPPAWVAEQMGHSLKVHLDHYVHVIAELGPEQRVDPEAMIWAAREKHRPQNGHGAFGE